MGIAIILKKFHRAADHGYRNGRATGAALKAISHELFHEAKLYAPSLNTLRAREISRNADYSLKRIQLDLECGFPITGLMSWPHKPAKGMVYIAHGMATTPERCFDAANPDYMNGIGDKLTRAGFVVWSPFVPQGGNNPSLSTISALLASQGIGFLNVLCSSLNSGREINTALGKGDLPIGQYGVSLDTTISLFLLAARGKSWPTVLSCGSFEDGKTILASKQMANNAGSALIGFWQNNPKIGPFLFPGIARLTRPAPLYLEYGADIATGNEERMIGDMRKIYQEAGVAGSLIVSERFIGGHEAKIGKSLSWLLSAIQRTAI